MRGELKAALDMLELAGSYARQCGATQEEIHAVVESGPIDLETHGGEAIEVAGAQIGEPGEWRRIASIEALMEGLGDDPHAAPYRGGDA